MFELPCLRLLEPRRRRELRFGCHRNGPSLLNSRRRPPTFPLIKTRTKTRRLFFTKRRLLPWPLVPKTDVEFLHRSLLQFQRHRSTSHQTTSQVSSTPKKKIFERHTKILPRRTYKSVQKRAPSRDCEENATAERVVRATALDP